MLIATLFLAAVLRVDPPSPDNFTRIKLGITAFTCGVPVPNVTVNGHDIDITVEGHGACIPEFLPFPMNVYVGPLPPGVYTVHTKDGTIASEATFIVRDTSSFHYAPYAAPVSGGITTLAEPVDALPFTKVVPPSPPGLVDGFIYFDPAQPPDLTHAEPVLFPIAFDGDGALGSQWRTENTLAPRPTGPGPVLYRPLCDGCPAQIATPTTLPSMSRPDGYLLWLGLGSGELLNATSRIHDISRESDNLGTAIPVVRRRDFAAAFALTGIPVDARYRALLRVWSLDDDPVSISIDSFNYHAPLTLTRINAGGPLFGSLDLGAAIAMLPAGTKTFDVRVSAVAGSATVWPMISVTNNQTQQVTIFTSEPQ